MPQIGWFEILIIVVIAILVIGPKDFPIVLRKIGNWIGSTKRYFSDIQQKVTKFDEEIEDNTSVEDKYSEKSKEKKMSEKTAKHHLLVILPIKKKTDTFINFYICNFYFWIYFCRKYL